MPISKKTLAIAGKMYKDKIHAISRYATLISTLSCPRDRLDDYTWQLKNLKKINDNTGQVEEVLSLLTYIKQVQGETKTRKSF